MKMFCWLYKNKTVDICVFPRNLGQKEKGCLQEIGFEEFVTVLSVFRPPKPRTAEDKNKTIKEEKLRCEETLSIALFDLADNI